MVLYTEEAATEEECISKISRTHKIEKHDFNDKVKIIRVRRMTRGVFLGMLKKNVVEVTYLFAPQLELAPSAKRGEYTPSVKTYAAAQNLSVPAASETIRYSVPQGSNFDENRRKLLDSVLEANPDIKEKVSQDSPPVLVKTAARRNPQKANGTGRKAKKTHAQLDLLAEDDFSDSKQNAAGQSYSGGESAATDKEEIKQSAESQEAVSGEMQALIQEVRKIGQRIDMDAELGKSGNEEHRNISRLMDILELNDFTPSFMNGIREKIRSNFTIEALSDFDYLQRRVLSWTGSCIKIAPEHSIMRPHLITLVGPTGAGKTTTVAKLAAAYIRAYKKATRPLNVRVITIDNYRIGAKQHLEKYGEIMGITVSSAETRQDLHKLVAFYQDADIILIDTTGRSPKDHAEIANMRTFFEGLQNSCETLLTVSACTKASDLHDIIRQYGIFPLDGLIITKFDETSRVGNIISMLAGENLPVSYITTGQRVPKDFEPASVMKFLLALEGFSVNILGMREEFPDPEKRFEWS